MHHENQNSKPHLWLARCAVCWASRMSQSLPAKCTLHMWQRIPSRPWHCFCPNSLLSGPTYRNAPKMCLLDFAWCQEVALSTRSVGASIDPPADLFFHHEFVRTARRYDHFRAAWWQACVKKAWLRRLDGTAVPFMCRCTEIPSPRRAVIKFEAGDLGACWLIADSQTLSVF